VKRSWVSVAAIGSIQSGINALGIAGYLASAPRRREHTAPFVIGDW
jgi:hypothetical protein